jgi:uncharacterized membrane protein/uncharacterized metal-binding protein
MEPACASKGGAKRSCADARRYVDGKLSTGPKLAVASCEGACAKGEVARMAATVLDYRLKRDRTVRICLGDALTGGSGMAEFLLKGPSVVVIEGCLLRCPTELLPRRFADLSIQEVLAPRAYSFDRPGCFEILDAPREELELHATTVAEHAQAERFGSDRARRAKEEAMEASIDAREIGAPRVNGFGRRTAVAMLLLSLLGLTDAFYVAQAAATGRTMYCILFDGCNVVTQSPYGRFYGAPLSFLGVIFYLCTIGLAGLLTFDPLSRGLRAGALILSGAGVGYSAFSMYLQLQYIHALCSYCVISAVVTGLLLSTAVWHFFRTRPVST